MIKSIQLLNFQSHEKSELTFSPGVSVITGKSDSGKSSILRSLYWVLTNRPSTTDFIRTGSGSVGKRGASKLGTAEVQILLERDRKEILITRTRGEGINTCSVGNKKFSTIGKDVPEEVLQALNLNKINIQRQLDQPFLILDSPGAVAAEFNRATNLDKVDEVVTMLSSDLRDRQARKSLAEEQLKKIQEDLVQFGYLDEFEKLVEVQEEIQNEALKKSSDAAILATRIADAFQIEKETNQAQNTISMLKPLLQNVKLKQEDAEKKEAEFLGVSGEVLDLTVLVESIGEHQARIDEIKLEAPTLQKELESQKLLSSIVEDFEKTEDQFMSLHELIEGMCETDSGIQTMWKVVNQHLDQLKEEKRKFEDVDECPTCGQKLLGKSKQVMLGNLR